MRRVLLTGANGFIGSALSGKLKAQGWVVRAALRSTDVRPDEVEVVIVGDINAHTDWSAALAGVDFVVHLAARVPVMRETGPDPLAVLRVGNVDSTERLAEAAAQANVRRIVFLSSIKVNGELTTGSPFTEIDSPTPLDSYAISKLEAEVRLRQIAAETGMEVVVIRPPLVYGPGVKGNFSVLMRWVKRGVPLPLRAVTYNRRSLVALDNLVDLVATCIDHPAAANQTFLVSDGEDLSTADLLRRLGLAMGRPARLLPVPPTMLMAGARMFSKAEMAQRLLGSLQVDISHTCHTLHWKPPISVDEGLRRVIQGMAQ